MTDVETYIVQGDGLTLDAILWQRYQRRTPGLVERTLDLNQGLAALGPVIPSGTKIMIPVIAAASTVKVVPVRKLWD